MTRRLTLDLPASVPYDDGSLTPRFLLTLILEDALCDTSEHHGRGMENVTLIRGAGQASCVIERTSNSKIIPITIPLCEPTLRPVPA
jgi:hypothetical protein